MHEEDPFLVKIWPQFGTPCKSKAIYFWDQLFSILKSKNIHILSIFHNLISRSSLPYCLNGQKSSHLWFVCAHWNIYKFQLVRHRWIQVIGNYRIEGPNYLTQVTFKFRPNTIHLWFWDILRTKMVSKYILGLAILVDLGPNKGNNRYVW